MQTYPDHAFAAHVAIPKKVLDAVPAETWLRALLEDASVIVAIVDEHGQFVLANGACARLFDRSPKDMNGMSLSELLPVGVARERVEHIGQVMRTNRPAVIDGMISGMWLRCACRPLVGRDNACSQVLITCTSSTSMLEMYPEELGEVERAEVQDMGMLGVLTKRQLEVLWLIGEGLTTSQIAAHLSRAVKTIEQHRSALGNKLGIRSRIELAEIARRSGLRYMLGGGKPVEIKPKETTPAKEQAE